MAIQLPNGDTIEHTEFEALNWLGRPITGPGTPGKGSTQNAASEAPTSSGRHSPFSARGKAPSSESDYDYEGAIKAGVKPDERGHWPDTYKKPNHITFSDESIHHGSNEADLGPKKNRGGHWEQLEDKSWTFTPGETNFKYHTPQEMIDYFKKNEPGNHLLLPGSKNEHIDHEHDVPLLAASLVNDKGEHYGTAIDRRIPHYMTVQGVTFPTHTFVSLHEAAETPHVEKLTKEGMGDVEAYKKAHDEVATPAEREAVSKFAKEHGKDPDTFWKEYQGKWSGWSQLVSGNPPERVHPDTYLKPYESELRKQMEESISIESDDASKHRAGADSEGMPKIQKQIYDLLLRMKRMEEEDSPRHQWKNRPAYPEDGREIVPGEEDEHIAGRRLTMMDDKSRSNMGDVVVPRGPGGGGLMTREEFIARNKALRATGKPAPEVKSKPTRPAGYDPDEIPLDTGRAPAALRPPLKGRSEDFPGSIWEQRPELKAKLQEYIDQGRVKPSGAESGGLRRAETDSIGELAKELGLTRNQIIGKLNRMRKE